MTNAVKYRRGADNNTLRMALFLAWGEICYWCRYSQKFENIEIDHIIPRAASTGDVHRIRGHFGLGPEFDINDPWNLAPICRTCNGAQRKGAHFYPDVPFYRSLLETALRHRNGVIQCVHDIRSGNRLQRHFSSVLEADLDELEAGRIFDRMAPLVIRRLHSREKGGADFTRYNSQLDGYYSPGLAVSLDARGRMAAEFLEQICGCPLHDVVDKIGSDLLDEIRRRASDRVEFSFDMPVSMGDMTYEHAQVAVNSLDYGNADDGGVEFTFSGSFTTVLNVQVIDVYDMSYDGGAESAGTFAVSAYWNSLMERGRVTLGDLFVDSAEHEIFMD